MEHNRASTGTFYLTMAGVIVAVAMLALMVWSRLYPDPAKAPTVERGALMSGYGWGPPIVLGIILVITTILNLVGGRRSGRKLKTQLKELTQENKTLCGDLAAMNSARGKAEQEGERIKIEMAQSKSDAAEARREASHAKAQQDITAAEWHKCEDQLSRQAWLVKLAITQAENIQNHVVVKRILPGTLKLADDRFVMMCLEIRNESLLNITIGKAEVMGPLSFRGKAMTESVKVTTGDLDYFPPVENLGHKQIGWLVLEQPLTRAEAGSSKHYERTKGKN
jgi:hypothetical protein